MQLKANNQKLKIANKKATENGTKIATRNAEK